MIKILTATIETTGRTGRRQAEREAALRLVRGWFGSDATIAHREDGAPYVEGRGEYISVSHCADQCVVAVSDAPVGVDVETRRAQLLKIAPRFLTPREQAEIGSLGELDRDSQLDLLLHYWTAKEAVFKCASLPDLVISEIEVTLTTACDILDPRAVSTQLASRTAS
ncbi:MAG: 4'-phosphopantetheinyl transferase superfamily protein, partial [Duncaniella sp.]|nr:4'-phosphopantetheinyl transferase superfamily protein [Duncaniella sp.]